MLRFFLSTALGVALGIAFGLLVGWGLAPRDYVDSPLSALAQRYRDDYTVNVAAGFVQERDAIGALERLRPLGEENVPEYVQRVTERFITTSRDVSDIRLLVALAEGLGRITPLMENFRLLNPIEGAP